MDWIGTALGVAGIAPTVVVGIDRARSRLPHRRVLGFASKQGIEIIVTTSSSSGISDVGPADDAERRARRDLIPSGDLAGVGDLCVMISRAYQRRPWVITPSTRSQDDDRRDQILVGGPVHNRYTSQLISQDRGDTEPVVFDAGGRYIRLGSYEVGPGVDLDFVDNVPQVEYGIIYLSEVRKYGRNQRVVAIGGLTTYGTHAACHFAATDLPKYCKAQKLGRRPNVCILVKATIVNTRPYDVSAVHNIKLEHTGTRR